MTDAILVHEPLIRVCIFLAALLIIAIWEAAAPCRTRSYSRWLRWPSNIGLVTLNSLLLRLIFPLAAVGTAALAQEKGWGLFNLLDLPEAVVIFVAIIVLDFAIYLQHVMFHAVPALWRLHRMHHADLDFDVTTGTRFHPFEILLSMVVKLMVVSALGAPPVAVIVFEVLLNGTAMFNHGNIRLPGAFDRVLRWIVVTPDMHRVHHSVIPHEANSNFGFNLPWWDRLCGTYRDQPGHGHTGMTVGLDQFRESRELRLDRLLMQPFQRVPGSYGLGRSSDRQPPAS